MKYSCVVEIEGPIEKVAALWSDERYFKDWQDGFIQIEHIRGEKDAVGATSRIYYKQGKREMELLETVVVNNLPIEKTALYEHKHMTNTQTTIFKTVNDNRTRYISEVEYLKFNGFVPKLMSKLFPGMFKKQSMKWMNRFKLLAEQKLKN